MRRLLPLLLLLLILTGCGAAGVEGTSAPSGPASTDSLLPAPDDTPPAEESTPEITVPVYTPGPGQSAPPAQSAAPAPEDTPPAQTPDPTPPAATSTSCPETPPGEEESPGEDAPPTDEEVLAAYHKAAEAWSWFDLETLPCDPADRVEQDGAVFYRVDYPGLHTLADLRGYLKGLFSDELVDALLPPDGQQYVEVDGVLYVQSGGRGADLTRGGESVQVMRDEAGAIWVQVEVEELDPEQDFAVVGTVRCRFPYQKVGEKWIFTEFSSVR